jgi:hypothetical protein
VAATTPSKKTVGLARPRSIAAMIASSFASFCIAFTVETCVVFGQHVLEKVITRSFLVLHESIVSRQSILSCAGCAACLTVEPRGASEW